MSIRHAAWVLTAGFFALLAVPSAGVAQAQAVPEDERSKLATTLLDQAYTREVILAWRRMLASSKAVPPPGCSAEEEAKIHAAWHRAVDGTFNPDGAYAAIREAFADAFTVSELAKLVAFRNTHLGRKLSGLERPPAIEPEPAASIAEIDRMRKALAADPVRKRVLEEITQALGGVEAQVDMLINMSLGSALGAQAALPPGQPRLSAQETIAFVERNRAPMLRGMGSLVLNWYAVIYQSLTLEELQQYRDELKSELGQRSTRVALDTFNQLMRAQSLVIGARFTKQLNAQDL